MFIPRHLLLYGAIAATFTATAQGMCDHAACDGGNADPREKRGTAVISMPALGQVIARRDGRTGSMKADVFRYKYKQKASAVPVHTVAGGTGHGTHAAQQSVDRSARSKRLVIE